jgi:hypothetical protein
MVGYKENNLLVIGRSIGSGPATHIAKLKINIMVVSSNLLVLF